MVGGFFYGFMVFMVLWLEFRNCIKMSDILFRFKFPVTVQAEMQTRLSAKSKDKHLHLVYASRKT